MLISRLFHSHITFGKKEFWKATGLVFSEGFLEAEPVWILLVGWGIISSMYIVGARTKIFFFFSCVLGKRKKQKENKKRTSIEQKEWKESVCFNSLSRCVDFFSIERHKKRLD